MNVLTLNGKKWEVTGEFRKPVDGEWYLSIGGKVHRRVGLSQIGNRHKGEERNILKPAKWEPEHGELVYLVGVLSGKVEQMAFDRIWQPEYEQGLIRENEEEAEALLKGLLKLSKEFEL